jgi:hypothetical protein
VDKQKNEGKTGKYMMKSWGELYDLLLPTRSVVDTKYINNE